MEERDWLDYLVAIGTLVTPVMVLLVGAIVWNYQRSFESKIRLEEQRRDDRREHLKWLRDQRLSAYGDLTRDLLSFGNSRGVKRTNTLEGYAVASRAMLLTDDEDLIEKIDSFLLDLDHFTRLQEQGKKTEGNALTIGLWNRARDIVSNLRTSLAQE